MKIPAILLLSVLQGWLAVNAQLNESDTVKFQLRTSLTGNYQQGNVNVLSVRGKLDFSVASSGQWVIKSQNSSLYQEFGKIKADNDVFSRNWIYYQPQNKFYPYVVSYISSNYRRKIDTRYFAGAGITWQMISSVHHVIKLSVNTLYEMTRFKNETFNFTEYNGSNRIRLWRGTLYMAGWSYLLKRHLRLYYDAYWQPAFDNNHNYRTQFDIGLDCPLWTGLAFTALYTYTHENVVTENIKPDDRIFTFGLSYNMRKK